ncbi:Thioesterase/thiol ester dehydrase-isomerase [Meredithblackwellia eburnea MCA 4105]
MSRLVRLASARPNLASRRAITGPAHSNHNLPSISTKPQFNTTSNSNSRKSFSFLSSSAFLTVGLLSGFTLALVAPRPNLLALLFPVPTPVSPGADTPEGRTITAQVEAGLQNLQLVKQLRAQLVPALQTQSPNETSLTSTEDTTELVPAYTESRPYAASVPGPHSLSAYTLRGPGKFAVAPLVFTTRDKKEAVFFVHVGGGMCGHEGVVHGGLLATLLDESLGRTAFYSLPNNIGVTATLTVKYRKPTFANQYLVIKTHTERAEGRKVWVKGRIENLSGETLVEAEALFVEPRMAKFLNSSTVKEALK